MTPERLAEIRELRQQTMSQVGTPTMYIIALRKGLDDLLAACDALTAENATLKGEVERLQMIALCGDKSHLLVIRERDTLRTRLDALVTAGDGAKYQTPDTVGEYRYLLVYDSGDTWEDSGYCYSREAERIMNRHEAELQFSTRREDERPELYVLMPLKQHDALRSALDKAKESA